MSSQNLMIFIFLTNTLLYVKPDKDRHKIEKLDKVGAKTDITKTYTDIATDSTKIEDANKTIYKHDVNLKKKRIFDEVNKKNLQHAPIPNGALPHSTPTLTRSPINRAEKKWRKQLPYDKAISAKRLKVSQRIAGHEPPIKAPSSTEPRRKTDKSKKLLLNKRPGESVQAWRQRNKHHLKLQRLINQRITVKNRPENHRALVLHILLKRRKGETIDSYNKRLQHLRNKIHTTRQKSPHMAKKKKQDAARKQLNTVPVAMNVRLSHRTVIPTRVQIKMKQKKMTAFIKSRTHDDNSSHKQLQDARRDLVKTYLLIKLFNLIHQYVKKQQHRNCFSRYINMRVGVVSPVFGGVALSVSRMYLRDVNLKGFDDTMSRVELWGCQNLPHHKRDLYGEEQEPCGDGSSTLIWVWYNGHDTLNFPSHSSVEVGYSTDIHYLISRLVKFKYHQKPSLSLGLKTVKVTFKDCRKRTESLLGSYNFAAAARVPINKFLTRHKKPKIDIACRHVGNAFKIYGIMGKMGIYGKKIYVYQNNGTQTLIYAFSGLNHVHTLETPFLIEPDDVIQVRCTYYQKAKLSALPPLTPYSGTKMETCKVYLLTMVESSRTAPESKVCHAESDFTTIDDEKMLHHSVSSAWHWVSKNKYTLVLVLCCFVMLCYFLFIVVCRKNDPDPSSLRYMRVRDEEIQNLMKEYGNDKYQ